MWNYFVSAVVVLILILVRKYLTRNYKYWKDRGIPTAGGIFPGFGHMLSVFMLKKNLSAKLHEIYANSNASMVGIFDMNKPALLVRDPELVKTVLQTEFSSFSDHTSLDPRTDPLLAMDPFFVNGDMWKHTRGVFTSAFSSKKLKFIATVAKDGCDKLVKFIDKQFEGTQNETIEIDSKDLFSKFTSQMAGGSILGLEGNAFVGPNPLESLKEMMASVLEINLLSIIKQTIVSTLPFMNKLLKVSFVPQRVNERFTKLVADICEVKKKSQSAKREDLLQHIIDYELETRNSEELVAPHAFSFYIETYETSSLALSAASYLLAKHPDIQNRARVEVIRLIDQHGEICYEAITGMVYLEQILRETLRLFSPVGKLQKICTKVIKIQGSDGLYCTTKPGDEVYISIMGLHYDPQIWDNPEQFNPDRFAKDSTERRHKFTYLPFGEGPRMCPGMRMALLQTKAVMAAILKNYVIKPSLKMIEPVKLDQNYFLTTVVGGFKVQLQKL